jgi:uncharacterized membrane protein
MKTSVFTYLIAGIAFLGLDFVWLGVMGNALYRPQLGNLVLEKFLLPPAAAFYLIYPIGIAVFAVSPALQAGSALMALGYGLLFGFLAYATYNLTNMSTLRGWSAVVTTVDTFWGAVATGAAAIIAYWIMKLLTKA